MLTALREQSEVLQDVKMVDPNKSTEMGRITLGLKFSPHSFEQRIEEDKRKIAKYYFDVFVDDQNEVKERAEVIEKMCQKQQEEFEKTMSKLDFMRSAHKGVLFEIENLKQVKEELEVPHFGFPISNNPSFHLFQCFIYANFPLFLVSFRFSVSFFSENRKQMKNSEQKSTL